MTCTPASPVDRARIFDTVSSRYQKRVPYLSMQIGHGILIRYQNRVPCSSYSITKTECVRGAAILMWRSAGRPAAAAGLQRQPSSRKPVLLPEGRRAFSASGPSPKLTILKLQQRSRLREKSWRPAGSLPGSVRHS